MIVDYSTIRPPVRVLTSLGITAVGRYIGWDGQPGFASTGKNITRAEAAQLRAAGIAVFLAFEYAADAAAGGAPQGARDGQLATRQLSGLGAPPLIGVYFTVDFDIPDYAPHLPDTAANAKAKLGPVGDYFTVINEQQPSYRVGGYGGYWAIRRLFDAGLIILGWQTIAWSPRNKDGSHVVDPRASLFQTTQAVPIAGADYNVHEGTAADFGQWPRPQPPPGPAPAARPADTEETMIVLDMLVSGGPAAVLPVPAGKTRIVFHADPGYKGQVHQPSLRVIFNAGGEQAVSPVWPAPAAVPVPKGATQVSLARLDDGDVPVTAAFT